MLGDQQIMAPRDRVREGTMPLGRGIQSAPQCAARVEAALERARLMLPPSAVLVAEATGRAMPIDRVISDALRTDGQWTSADRWTLPRATRRKQ
jgi:hypothetical protein